MPKHHETSPCSSCRSVRDACTTCGPNRDEADDVIAPKTRSGNRRQSGRLVYLMKREEEEESKKCQDITHELKVRLKTMKEGEEPRPSTSGAAPPPVSRSNSCPVNKGRRHHNTRQHNSTKKNNRGVNDTSSAGQGGETSSADRELSQSGRSRSNSSSSSSNQPSFSPRVTRATSERDG